MKILVLSDLHIEFAAFQPSPVVEPDVVILAGDLGEEANGFRCARLIKNYYKCPVIYVLGNHEYYIHESRVKVFNYIKEQCSIHGITLLENSSIMINDVNFIGATLWSDFNIHGNQEQAMRYAQKGISDFSIIRNDNGTIKSPQDQINDFEYSRYYINEELKKHDKNIVITHFGCSRQSIHPKYIGNNLNPYFTSDLESVILEHQPLYWIHGHTHSSLKYNVGNTIVLTNPRGYVNRHTGKLENPDFKPDYIIEV